MPKKHPSINTSNEPLTIITKGYGSLDKPVSTSIKGNSAYLYLPKKLAGKKVRIIFLEEPENQGVF